MTRTSITEYQFWVRVLRMAAAIIGAVVALWLLSGDRNPEAAQLLSDRDAPYSQMATVVHHNTFDTQDIQFFEVRFGQQTGGDGSGTGFVISADSDLKISQWLAAHHGQRVLITFQSTTPLTRDGHEQ